MQTVIVFDEITNDWKTQKEYLINDTNEATVNCFKCHTPMTFNTKVVRDNNTAIRYCSDCGKKHFMKKPNPLMFADNFYRTYVEGKWAIDKNLPDGSWMIRKEDKMKRADLVVGEIVTQGSSNFKAQGEKAKVIFVSEQKVLCKFDSGVEVCFTREKYDWYKWEKPILTHEEIMGSVWVHQDGTELRVVRADKMLGKYTYKISGHYDNQIYTVKAEYFSNFSKKVYK